jgi:hypothetical protein
MNKEINVGDLILLYCHFVARGVGDHERYLKERPTYSWPTFIASFRLPSY